MCYMSSSRLPLLGFLLFPLPFSRAAVSPIIFSIVGIWERPFPFLSGVCSDPFPLPPPPSAIYPRPMPPVSSAAVTVPHPGCSALLPTWLSTSFTDEWAVLGERLSLLRGPPRLPPGTTLYYRGMNPESPPGTEGYPEPGRVRGGRGCIPRLYPKVIVWLYPPPLRSVSTSLRGPRELPFPPGVLYRV